MSFTTPVNVYSKTYWIGFISAVNEEAAYELGLHDKINEKALPKEGWSAAQFTPNILRYSDVYVDRSTNIDLSSRVIHEHHHHHTNSSSRPLSKEEQEAKKKEEEENSLQKYQWLGPIIGAIGAFLAAYTWRGYQRCKATYDHTLQVKNKCTKLRDAITIKPTLERIVDIKLKVDETRYEILKRYFFACAGILVGGGLFTLGAYLKLPSLIPSGKVALAASAIWAAASAGFHWQDNRDIRTLYKTIALKPDHLAETTLSDLHWYYEECMSIKRVYAQTAYQPFFNGVPEGYVPVYAATHSIYGSTPPYDDDI